MLSVQCMAGFGNLRPEVNWQCIDFDPMHTAMGIVLVNCHLKLCFLGFSLAPVLRARRNEKEFKVKPATSFKYFQYLLTKT